MNFRYFNIVFILALFIGSSFYSAATAQKLPARAGKQCKILGKNYKAKRSKTKIKTQRIKSSKNVEQHQDLQSSLMTNEEYDQLVKQVQKNLPEYDVMNDCPVAFKRKADNKLIRLKNIFKKRGSN